MKIKRIMDGNSEDHIGYLVFDTKFISNFDCDSDGVMTFDYNFRALGATFEDMTNSLMFVVRAGEQNLYLSAIVFLNESDEMKVPCRLDGDIIECAVDASIPEMTALTTWLINKLL